MVLSYMNSRKCIYTGLDAQAKDNVIPKSELNLNELHNWANKAPVSLRYKEVKSNRMPNDLEILANETFHLLELAKLKVLYLENKLIDIQKELKKNLPPVKKSKNAKKEREIEQAHHEVDVIKEADKKIEKTLSKRRKKSTIWD